ncbi:hypothetical protein [Bradyrhizobium sp. JR18.2]|uniref:hypothetical protein n=1 Tax=Bradyrhizobium sp. JR18.2 TaxID=3156369 RepID=UPI00339A92A4
MADIPLPWQTYAALQSNLDTRTSVDALSWGMEEGLNRLLDGEASLSQAGHVDRIVANAVRRDRYGRSLLAKHIIIRNEVYDGPRQTEARSSLALLQHRMAADKLDLLVELASGIEPKHVAERRGIAVGALRTRVARAREVARDMAA